MANKRPTLGDLQEFWFRQFDAVLNASTSANAEEIAEAMITVAAARLLERSDAQSVAARLATIAGGVYAMGADTKASTIRH